MRNFFNRREEEIEENLYEEDGFEIIDLDDTAEWSKLDVAAQLAKQQAENLMEEIGDELAIIDAVEEDTFIEELRQGIVSEESTYETEISEAADVVLEEAEVIREETDVALEETKVIGADVVVVLKETEELQEDEIEPEYLQDEDIEYLSDEDENEEYEEEDEGFTFFENLAAWFSRWTVMDKVIAVTGVLVLVLAIATAGLFAADRGVNKQVAAFAPVGEQLETIGITGQDKLLAVADAKKAMLEAAKLEAELNQEYEENDLSTEVKVIMKMTTVQKDLKIKFVNKKTGKLVGNVPFEVKIKDSEGKTYNKIDEDKDGIIYLTDIVPGSYSVSMMEMDDLEGYTFSTSAEKIKVKDKIEYEKIDVSDEIKDQSEVDASKEDTAQKTETEEVLEDTVEWVISEKKAAGTETTYKAVDKSTIAEPSLTASLNFDFGILRIMQQSMLADNLPMTIDEGDDITNPPAQPPADGGNGGDDTTTTTPGGENPTPGGNESGGNPNSQLVNSITLSGTATLEVDGTTTLIVNVSPEEAANKEVTWSSSDTGVATIDSSTGFITAVAPGDVTITATAKDGSNVSGSHTIKVSAPNVAVTSVALGKTSLELAVDGTYTLTATVKPANASNTAVTWSSSDETIAKVDSTGKVTAVKAGNATITATANSDTNIKASCTVTVSTANVAVTSVTLDKTSLDLAVNGTYTLTATVAPANASNKAVSWVSSNESIAKVEGEGKVTALKDGTATITVTAKDGSGKTASCKVTVSNVSAITLDKTSMELAVNGTHTLVATTTPAGAAVTWTSSDATVAKVEGGKVTALKDGTATITAKAGEKTATCKVTVGKKYDPKTDTTKLLKDKGGNQMYILVNGQYVEAKVADYYKSNVTFYKKETVTKYVYTGWQNLDGKTYYFDKNGNKVTGQQVIQGAKYNFNSDGTLNNGSGVLGIDVSTHNGNIDWNKVKSSGVSYVIIRTGYRGSTQGSLVEDNKFRQNIKGATNAGLKVGVYFFSQAINEVEAVEEASMVLSQIKGYKLAYPVFIDVEPSGGRADGLSTGDRTKVVNAFCQTIQNNGYKAGIYANKSWFTNKLNTSALSGYKIWLAQYNSTVTYKGRYDMWQYSDKGKINGISGNVDMNLSYLSY